MEHPPANPDCAHNPVPVSLPIIIGPVVTIYHHESYDSNDEYFDLDGDDEDD